MAVPGGCAGLPHTDDRPQRGRLVHFRDGGRLAVSTGSVAAASGDHLRQQPLGMDRNAGERWRRRPDARDAIADGACCAAQLADAHTSGTDLASWKPAVVATQGPAVATQIYEALSSGESRTTSAGEKIT